MNKQDEYKIGGAANEFVNKHRSELSPIKKAELEAMLKDFAIKQVKELITPNLSTCYKLEYCPYCLQMTNHLNNVCQKPQTYTL
jgi:hypothetical protein